MPKFPTAADAYRWAVGVLHLSRSARALNYDPDMVGQTAVYGDYARLDALQIVIAAEEVCRSEDGCQHDMTCLLRWCLPAPDGSFGYWTESEKARVNGCLKELEKRLVWMNFIDYAARGEE